MIPTKEQIENAAVEFWDADHGTHSLADAFTSGAEWAIQQNFCKHDVSGCKELEAQKPNKGITFKITKYHPEIFIDDVGDVE